MEYSVKITWIKIIARYIKSSIKSWCINSNDVAMIIINVRAASKYMNKTLTQFLKVNKSPDEIDKANARIQ